MIKRGGGCVRRASFADPADAAAASSRSASRFAAGVVRFADDRFRRFAAERASPLRGFAPRIVKSILKARCKNRHVMS